MGRVTGYVEYTASGVAQHERYAIVHDLRGQVIAEKGRTLLAKTNGGFDTLYTHTVNNYSELRCQFTKYTNYARPVQWPAFPASCCPAFPIM
jgi:hypothetical protein